MDPRRRPRLLAAAALIKLARGATVRPWRSPLYPLFPLVYGGLAVFVVVANLVVQPWKVTRIGLIPLSLGVLTYFVWSNVRRGQKN